MLYLCPTLCRLLLIPDNINHLSCLSFLKFLSGPNKSNYRCTHTLRNCCEFYRSGEQQFYFNNNDTASGQTGSEGNSNSLTASTEAQNVEHHSGMAMAAEDHSRWWCNGVGNIFLAHNKPYQLRVVDMQQPVEM